MPTITFLSNGGKTAEVDVETNLLRASLRWKGGIPFKCGAGNCGTCRCRIERGLEHTDAVKPKERNHLSDDDFRGGWRMACQTFVRGDVAVSWPPPPVGTAAHHAAGTSAAQHAAPTPPPSSTT